ncbi:hypothetical protein [[Eubacterium] cellulosolvens]
MLPMISLWFTTSSSLRGRYFSIHINDSTLIMNPTILVVRGVYRTVFSQMLKIFRM